MNKLFYKVASGVVGIAMAIGVGVAIANNNKKVVSVHASTTYTVTPANCGWSTTGGAQSGTPFTGITIAATNGILTTGSRFTTYKNATFSVTSTIGNIEQLDFTFNGSNTGGFSTTVTPNAASWSQKTTSGSSGTQAQITQLVITIAGSSGPTLESIAVSGTMSKVTYTTAESWDPTGLVVTGTYSDSSTDNTLASSATFAYYSDSAMTTSKATPNDLGVGANQTLYVKATVSGVSNAAGYAQTVSVATPSYTDVLNLNGETVYIKTSSGDNYISNSLGTSYVHPSVSNAAGAQPYTFSLVGNDTYTIQASGGTYDGYYLSSNGSSGSSNKMFLSTTTYSWTGSEVDSELLLQDASSKYLACYSSSDWRCYTDKTSAQSALAFPDASSVTTYTISFDAGSHATGTKASTSSAAGDYTLPDSTGFTPDEGYIFVGWKAENTGTTYEAGDTYTISADVTFYAQWVLGVGLSYNSNGGSGSMNTTYVVSGGTQTVASCSFTAPSNKVFSHWNTSGSDNGTSYNPGATIENFTSALTLYAIWEDAVIYTLVTDPTTLTDGTTFVLVGYASSTYRIASGLNSGHEKMNTITAATTISDGVNPGSTLMTSEADVFTLVGEPGAWEIKRENTFLEFNGSSNGNDNFTDTSSEDTLFTISGDATIDIVSNSRSGRYWRYNTSTGDLRNGASNYGTDLYMFAIIAPEKEIVDQRINTVGTVSASTGDTEWTIAGFEFQIKYDGEATWRTVSDTLVTYTVNIGVPTITETTTVLVNVTAHYKETITATATNVTANLTYVDFYSLYSIERLYTSEVNQSYVADGVYMGEVSDGYIFMNGEYGILVFDRSHASTLTIGTAYSLSGTLKKFSGLYELQYVTITEITNVARKNAVLTPIIYDVVGGEDETYANRKTQLTGYVTSMSSTDTGADSTVHVQVGSVDVTVYVKAAAATEKNMTALSNNLTANEGKTQDFILISMEGFTSYHVSGDIGSFQVALTQVVVPDDTYSVADFARDLLKMTLGVCTGGNHDNTTNKSALVAIWGQLAGASYYGKLTDAKKATLSGETADPSIVVPSTEADINSMSDANAIAAALYRYDYCTAKYNLTAFITGRTLSVSFSNKFALFGQNIADSDTTLIVIISSVLGVAAVGGYFFLRRKKEQ